ncbi:Glutamate-1-semialdehyde aminotransferase [hydrothermal vent metagenome]|uniref:glutamate-1-semialdehyde 2,1-aminomutase n=1 Tax=hydrothermal vent metagenome TaxID=652676 RepID=A0A3B1DYL7_9ZZZZ
MLVTANSQIEFQKAQEVIPGGVNSPVRSFSSVGGNPPFMDYGDGGYIVDIDDNKYIDYVQSWGPLILGHNDLEVQKDVIEAVKKSLSFGAPTINETLLVDEILSTYDFLDKIRLVNSGTEAVMSAIRLARGYTKKDNIIKFEGCYHGHSDSLLVQAGSGLATFGAPSSPGVPADLTKHTLLATYNDIDSVEQCFKNGDIACVIIEPIAGNMGLVPADIKFLQDLRSICDKNNALLIFDEVMSGFRASMGGACEITKVVPDIVTFGKVIGGGMPIGAFGASSKIIDELSPVGAIYQAGTLSGNPISTIAGLSTLKKLKKLNPFKELEIKAIKLTDGFKQIANKYGVDIQTTVRGSMFGFFFSKEKVNNFKEACKNNQELFSKFHRAMLERNVYLACSSFETGFISVATSDNLIDDTLDAIEDSFKNIL